MNYFASWLAGWLAGLLTLGGSCLFHSIEAASALRRRDILSSSSLTACFTSVSIAKSCHATMSCHVMPCDTMSFSRRTTRDGKNISVSYTHLTLPTKA